MLKKIQVVIICITMALTTILCSCSKKVTPLDNQLTIAKDNYGNDLYLVEDSISRYQIIIPKNKTVTEEIAANELQKLIFDSTGCLLSISNDEDKFFNKNEYCVSVGNTTILQGADLVLERDKLGMSGYMIKVFGHTIVLAALESIGILNSVYGFLEKEIQFRAYAVDEIYYKQVSSVPVYSMNFMHVSDIDVKYPYFGETFDAESLISAARMGLLAGQGGGNLPEGPLYGDGLWCHTTLKIIPEIIYSAEHPEWFDNKQLCLSNPEVVPVFAENLYKIIKNSPYSPYYMIGNADMETSCRCDKCSKAASVLGGNGGVFVKFMNDVSKLIDSAFVAEGINRKVYLVGLAYAAYKKPPVKKDSAGNWVPYSDEVICKDGVSIIYAQNYGCYAHAFNDSKCEINRPYAEDIKGWKVISDKFMIYTYGINFKDYFLYFNDFGNIKGNAQFFKEVGTLYIHTQGCTNKNSPFSALKLYLYSRLWDDSSLNYDELVKDFMKNYYGVANNVVYKFYNDLRNHFAMLEKKQGTACTYIYTYLGTDWSNKKFWDKDVLDNFISTLKQAYLEIENSSVSAERKVIFNNRIKSLEINIQYYLFKHYSSYYSSIEYQQLYKQFLDDCARLGITRGSEFDDDLVVR